MLLLLYGCIIYVYAITSYQSSTSAWRTSGNGPTSVKIYFISQQQFIHPTDACAIFLLLSFRAGSVYAFVSLVNLLFSTHIRMGRIYDCGPLMLAVSRDVTRFESEEKGKKSSVYIMFFRIRQFFLKDDNNVMKKE
jgi:hypothetical protein